MKLVKFSNNIQRFCLRGFMLSVLWDWGEGKVKWKEGGHESWICRICGRIIQINMMHADEQYTQACLKQVRIWFHRKFHHSFTWMKFDSGFSLHVHFQFSASEIRTYNFQSFSLHVIHHWFFEPDWELPKRHILLL